MGAARLLVSPARVFARPTADQIWLGPAQQSALSQLSGTKTRMLVGPPSCGKSTLLSHSASLLPRETVVLNCRGPKKDAASVLTSVLLSVDLAPWELSEVEQRNLFTVFVQQRRMQGRRVVLVIDDAHLFSEPAWQEIERLLAFRIEKKPAIELFLGGPTSLAGRFDLARCGLEPSQVQIHVLEPPTEEDLVSYVGWRLSRFEMGELVTEEGSRTIAQLSCGRYAAVNRRDREWTRMRRASGDRPAPVATIRCDVLGDAQFSEEAGIMSENVLRQLITVEVAQQSGNRLDDQRIGV